MKNSEIKLILILLILITLFSIYYFIFNIFETTVQVEPKDIFADNHSIVNISVVPVNALGREVPLRTVPAAFEFSEGKDLVDVIKEDINNGKLILRAKDRAGTVIIFVKSKYSLLPSLVEIHIYPNRA
jgi:hypothetical protein